MCGIVGVFGKEHAEELVLKGMHLLIHRGRDGYGFFDGTKVHFSSSLDFKFGASELALGHCLHAVVNKIHQPFRDKGVFAVNCEIYNYKELNEKYHLGVKNDAECFFSLLEKFSVKKTLTLLDGDFAGVYFRDFKVYLFRDRIGVKPLWYSLEEGLAVSSERKVLRKLGYTQVLELNPRELLIYDLKKKSVILQALPFFTLKKNKDSYFSLKKQLQGYLVHAVSKRIPDVAFGLLFSGGVDSSLLALLLKKLDVDFTCYTASFKDLANIPEDLSFSKRIAQEYGFKLKTTEVTLEELEKELPFICKLVESNNVTKISVALPFYFASRAAHKDGMKVLFSGQGSEELFAGYERHLKSQDINKESYNGLLNIYERDLYRDDVVTMVHSLELRVPFLDSALLEFALSIEGKYKLSERGNKLILREVAVELGLTKEYAFRKRKAAQYGSGFLKGLEKLTKKNGFTTMSAYLASLYNEGNVKLGVLFSSGKDSCYAMHIMKQQNYELKCLITLKSKNKDSYMYHTPNIDLVSLQAEALGLPLILQETLGEKEKELLDLEKALFRAKKEFGIEGIVVGALFSTYQRDRVQNVANTLGLKVFAPLWHKDQLTLLHELLVNHFEVIIVHVAADGLDESFLGRKLDKELISKLIELNKKNGINVAFEGGEAETLVLDCPMFSKKLKILGTEKNMSSEFSGTLKVKKAELIDK